MATGRCLCGAVQFRLEEEPLTFYACHCTDCQKRSGSAFGLSMWVRRAALEVTAGEAVLREFAGADGKGRPVRICGRCNTRLWSEPGRWPDLAVLRPGTLDDAGRWQPVAHIWTRSAPPWTVFSAGARFETGAKFDELLRLWRERPSA